MENLDTIYIYALTDPENDIVRYVGRSQNLKTRFYGHLHDRTRSNKVNWIKALRSNNKLPTIKILERTNREECERVEKKWITHYRKILGNLLTNISDGNEGIGTNKKLITFPDQLVEKIQKDADEKGISFNEMTRRLLDQIYDEKEKQERSNVKS